MDCPTPETASRRLPDRVLLSPLAAVLVALSFGLCAGYLDLGIILFRKLCWNKEGYFRTGRDFVWTIPMGHAVLLAIPGLLAATVNRLRPGVISSRAQGLVAVRDARDCGGNAEDAAVRRGQPFSGRRAGSSGQRRSCRARSPAADCALLVGRARRPALLCSRPSRRVGRGSRNTVQ